MIKWLVNSLKWLAKNPWIYPAFGALKDNVIKPLWIKYVKPIFKKDVRQRIIVKSDRGETSKKS